MTGKVQIRALGPIEVTLDGGGIAPLSPQLRRLLGVLAAASGAAVSKDRIAEFVAGGIADGACVRTAVSRLRKSLGGRVVNDGFGYRLALADGDSFDIAAFDELVAAARGCTGMARCEVLRRAVALWRGPAFDGYADEPWAQGVAARLDDARLVAVEDLAEGLIAVGRGAEAVGLLEAETPESGYRERLVGLLMEALHEQRRTVEALRVYRRFRTELRTSTGIEPTSQLRAVEARILASLEAESDALAQADRDDGISTRVMHDPGTEQGHNLPVPPTRYLVTDDRVSAVVAAVRHSPVVTLIGTGGVGKSRLALEAGWASLGTYDDGVWLVELAPVVAEDAVPSAVAAALSIPAQAGVSVQEAVVRFLERRSLLLMVDNCEHLVDTAARLLAAVAARCPSVHVLATSREPLGISAERIHVLSPLDPATASALFVDRALSADDGFLLQASDGETITAICERLDCIPLAIELAAARIRSFSPAELLRGVDDRFRLLRVANRGGLDRHRTLRVTVDWSYQMLDDRHRCLFNRLAIFAGGFDLHAAEAVGANDVIEAADVVDVLSDLVDKSMVNVERTPLGTRYELLETLRQFGWEQLVADDSSASEIVARLRDRHLEYYIATAEHADAVFRTREQLQGVSVFEAEWDNLRVAMNWALDSGDIVAAERLALAVNLYANFYGRTEHADWLDRILALETDDRTPSPATFGQAANWAFVNYDQVTMVALASRGIEVAPRPDDPSTALCWPCLYRRPDANPPLPTPVPPSEAFAHVLELTAVLDLEREWMLPAWIVNVAEDASVSRNVLDRLVAVSESVGAPALAVLVAIELGSDCVLSLEERSAGGDGAAASKPDFTAALSHFRRGAMLARQCRAAAVEAECLRGVALARAGLDPSTAARACHEALDKLSRLFSWTLLWKTMDSVVLVLAACGAFEPAAVILGYLDAHCLPYGLEHACGFRERTRVLLLDQRAVAGWMAHGERLEPQQVVDLALEALRTIVAQRHHHAGMDTSTPRLSLVETGRSAQHGSREHVGTP